MLLVSIFFSFVGNIFNHSQIVIQFMKYYILKWHGHFYALVGKILSF